VNARDIWATLVSGDRLLRASEAVGGGADLKPAARYRS
jgi:hypothetical protein